MSRQLEVDLGMLQTVDDFKKAVDDGTLSEEDVQHLFQLNRLPKPVMRHIDRQLGGRLPEPGTLEERLAEVAYSGDIGAADEIIEEDDDESDESKPPRSRGRSSKAKED